MAFRKVLISAGVLVLLAWAALFFLKNQAAKTQRSTVEVKLGSVMDDFILHIFNIKDSKSDKTLLSAILAKVYFVDFWATWCEACMVEMPALIELRKKYNKNGLELILINVDEKPEAILPKTLEDFGIDFPVFIDPQGNLAELFDVHAIPKTIILDRNRKILLVDTGEKNWNGSQMHTFLEKYLTDLKKIIKD